MSDNRIVTQKNNVIVRRELSSDRDKIFANFNKIWISGIIEEEFEYSHEFWWEKFYKTRVVIKRFSGTEDYVPIVVSNLLMPNILNEKVKGKYVEVGGQFRSYNKLGEDGRKHLELFLFATVIKVYESEEDFEEVVNANLIYLDGYICKEPVFRTTPLNRKITDLSVAVNRNYNKSDYIPCIAWGKNAYYASELEIGNRIKLYGRVQSRQYFKRFSPDSEEGEYRDAYEVSIMRIMKVDDLRLEG